MHIKDIKEKFFSLMNTSYGELLYFSLLLILAIIIYRDTLFYSYTGADFFGQIAGNTDLNSALAAPLSADFLGDTWYRPVDAFTLYFNYQIGGLDPFIYQLTNMMIFLFTTILIFTFVKQVTKNKKIAFFSSFIFILYPLTMNVLPIVTFRAEMLLAAFMVLTLLFLDKYYESNSKLWQILAIISAFLTVCSKEAGFIMMPLLIGFYIVLKNKNKKYSIKQLIISFIPYLACVAFYFFLIFALLGNYTARGLSTGSKGFFYIIFDRLMSAVVFFNSLIYPVDVLGLNNIKIMKLGGSFIGLGYFIVGFIGLFIVLFLIYKILKMNIQIKKIFDLDYITSFFTFDSFLIFWIFVYFAFFVSYGKYNSYYSYLLLPAVSIFIAKWYVNKKKTARFDLKKIIVILFIVYSIIATPIFMSYSNYETSSRIKEKLVPDILDKTQDLPDDASIYIVNYFCGVLGLGHATGIPPHSINGLLFIEYGDKNWNLMQVSQFVIKNADKPYFADFEIFENESSFTIELTGDNVRFYRNTAESSHPLGIRENVNVSGFLYPKESKNLTITVNDYNESDYIMLFYAENSETKVIIERIGNFLNR